MNRTPAFLLTFLILIAIFEYAEKPIMGYARSSIFAPDSGGKKADSLRNRERSTTPVPWARRTLDSMIRPTNFYLAYLDTTGGRSIDRYYIDSVYKNGLWRSRDTGWVLLGDGCIQVRGALGKTAAEPDTVWFQSTCGGGNCFAMRPFVYGYDSTYDSLSLETHVPIKKHVFIPIKDSTLRIDTCDSCKQIRIMTEGHYVSNPLYQVACIKTYYPVGGTSTRVHVRPKVTSRFVGTTYYNWATVVGMFNSLAGTLYGRSPNDSILIDWPTMATIKNFTPPTPTSTSVIGILSVMVPDTTMSGIFMREKGKFRLGDMFSDSSSVMVIPDTARPYKGVCCSILAPYYTTYKSPYDSSVHPITAWYEAPTNSPDTCFASRPTADSTWVYDTSYAVIVDTCTANYVLNYITNNIDNITQHITQNIYNYIDSSVTNIIDTCGCNHKHDTTCTQVKSVTGTCLDSLITDRVSEVHKWVCDSICIYTYPQWLDSSYAIFTNNDLVAIIGFDPYMTDPYYNPYVYAPNTICLKRYTENDSVKFLVNVNELMDPTYKYPVIPSDYYDSNYVCIPKNLVISRLMTQADSVRHLWNTIKKQVLRTDTVDCALVSEEMKSLPGFSRIAVGGTCKDSTWLEHSSYQEVFPSLPHQVLINVDTCNHCNVVKFHVFGTTRDTIRVDTIRNLVRLKDDSCFVDHYEGGGTTTYQPKRPVFTRIPVSIIPPVRGSKALFDSGIAMFGLINQIRGLAGPGPCIPVHVERNPQTPDPASITPVGYVTGYAIYENEYNNAVPCATRNPFEVDCFCVDSSALFNVIGRALMRFIPDTVFSCKAYLENDGPPITTVNCFKSHTEDALCKSSEMQINHMSLTWDIPDSTGPCLPVPITRCVPSYTDLGILRIDTLKEHYFYCDSIVPYVADTCKPCRPAIKASGVVRALCDTIEFVNICPDGTQPIFDGKRLLFSYACPTGKEVVINGTPGTNFDNIATVTGTNQLLAEHPVFGDVSDSLTLLRDRISGVNFTKIIQGTNVTVTGDTINGYTISSGGGGGGVGMQAINGLYKQTVTLTSTGLYIVPNSTDSTIKLSIKPDSVLAYMRDTSAGAFWNYAELDTSGNGSWYYKLPKSQFDAIGNPDSVTINGVKSSTFTLSDTSGNGGWYYKIPQSQFNSIDNPDSVTINGVKSSTFTLSDTSGNGAWYYKLPKTQFDAINNPDSVTINGVKSSTFTLSDTSGNGSWYYKIPQTQFNSIDNPDSVTINGVKSSTFTLSDTSGNGAWYYKLPKAQFDAIGNPDSVTINGVKSATFTVTDTSGAKFWKLYDVWPTPTDSGWIDINRNGFVDNTQTIPSFDSTNYTFTLADAGAGWTYYRHGIKRRVTGTKTCVIPGSPPSNGLYFFVIDADDGTITTSKVPWTLNDYALPVATVVLDSLAYPKYHLAEERHTVLIDRRIHRYLHFTRGTQLVQLGTPSAYSVAPSVPVDSNNTFAMSQGQTADEDLFETQAAMSHPLGLTDAYMVFYRKTASSWSWQKSKVPFLYTNGSYMQWDNNGTMTTGSNSFYYNVYLAAADFEGESGYISIPGRGEYSTLSAAQLEDPTLFNFTGLPISETVILYQFTYETKSSYSTLGQVRLAATPKVIKTAIGTVGGTATISHNSLTGLQGGTTNEYYHLTLAERNSILMARDSVTLNGVKSNSFTISAKDSTLRSFASGNTLQFDVNPDSSMAFLRDTSGAGFWHWSGSPVSGGTGLQALNGLTKQAITLTAPGSLVVIPNAVDSTIAINIKPDSAYAYMQDTSGTGTWWYKISPTQFNSIDNPDSVTINGVKSSTFTLSDTSGNGSWYYKLPQSQFDAINNPDSVTINGVKNSTFTLSDTSGNGAWYYKLAQSQFNSIDNPDSVTINGSKNSTFTISDTSGNGAWWYKLPKTQFDAINSPDSVTINGSKNSTFTLSDTSSNGAWYYKMTQAQFNALDNPDSVTINGSKNSTFTLSDTSGNGAWYYKLPKAQFDGINNPDSVTINGSKNSTFTLSDTSGNGAWYYKLTQAQFNALDNPDSVTINGSKNSTFTLSDTSGNGSWYYKLSKVQFDALDNPDSVTINNVKGSTFTLSDTSGNGAWYYKLSQTTFDNLNGLRDSSRAFRTYVSITGSGLGTVDSSTAGRYRYTVLDTSGTGAWWYKSALTTSVLSDSLNANPRSISASQLKDSLNHLFTDNMRKLHPFNIGGSAENEGYFLAYTGGQSQWVPLAGGGDMLKADSNKASTGYASPSLLYTYAKTAIRDSLSADSYGYIKLKSITDSLSANAYGYIKLKSITDTLSVRSPYTTWQGIATLATGDSVQVTATGITQTDMVTLTYSDNAKFSISNGATQLSARVVVANKLTIYGVAAKKVSYRAFR